MINHFLDTQLTIFGQQAVMPYIAKLNETNAATGFGSIGAQVDSCLMDMGRAPNVILLDYYDSNGNEPFVVANQLNGISSKPADVTPFTATAAASGSAAANGGAAQPTGDTVVKSQPINAGVRAEAGVFAVAAAAAMALLL